MVTSHPDIAPPPFCGACPARAATHRPWPGRPGRHEGLMRRSRLYLSHAMGTAHGAGSLRGSQGAPTGLLRGCAPGGTVAQ